MAVNGHCKWLKPRLRTYTFINFTITRINYDNLQNGFKHLEYLLGAQIVLCQPFSK